MVNTYPVDGTFTNVNFLPPNVATTVFGVPANAGQIYQVFYPKNADGTAMTSDQAKALAISRGVPQADQLASGKFAFVILCHLGGFTLSTKFTTVDITVGFVWKCLEVGLVVIMSQICPSSVANAAPVAGRGFFHPPGIIPAGLTIAPWEDETKRMPEKDVIHTIQNVLFNADAMRLDIRFWALTGNSSGAQIQAYCSLGKDHAGELGQGGQYEMSTIPNCALYTSGPFAFFKHYIQGADAALPAHFPSAAAGAPWETKATSLGDAGPAYGLLGLTYQELISVVGFCPDITADDLPPHFIYYDTDYGSADFTQPWVEGVATSGTLHTAWHGAVLKTLNPRKFFWAVASTVTANALQDFRGGAIGSDDDPNNNTANTNGKHIQWLLENIYRKKATLQNTNQAPVKVSMTTDGFIEKWYYGQVDTIGASVLGINPKREFAIIENLGPTNLLRFGPNKVMAVSQIDKGGALSVYGSRTKYYGRGRLWLKAGAATTEYLVREIIRP